jgi:ribosomal protein S18 acetylase RimI-like enzyme
VQLTSLGYQTDLALLRLGGSQIEDKGDHLVIRTPHNPSYWWGNFLLLPGPPPRSETQGWMEAFAQEFPDATHLTLGFDGSDGSLDDIAGFAEAGLTTETAAVMTAREVHPPPRPNTEAEYRPLTSDADWAQRVDLRIACKDDGHDPESYRIFAQAQSDTLRGLAEAGHGDWFGAFVDGQMLSSMGLYRASPGLARFQSVETHPDARGRGLAGTLVHYVSQYGYRELDAHTLVMVADPTYLAIRVYRSVGFAETESQLQAERPLQTPS